MLVPEVLSTRHMDSYCMCDLCGRHDLGAGSGCCRRSVRAKQCYRDWRTRPLAFQHHGEYGFRRSYRGSSRVRDRPRLRAASVSSPRVRRWAVAAAAKFSDWLQQAAHSAYDSANTGYLQTACMGATDLEPPCFNGAGSLGCGSDASQCGQPRIVCTPYGDDH
jgi:hypothetical protein